MSRDLDTDAAAIALSLTPGTIRDMCAAGKFRGAYPPSPSSDMPDDAA